MNLRDPNLPFNLTSFRALQDELRRMDAAQAPAVGDGPVARVTDFVGSVGIEAECLPHAGAPMKVGGMLYAGPRQALTEEQQTWARLGPMIDTHHIVFSAPESRVHRLGGPNAGWGPSGCWGGTAWVHGLPRRPVSHSKSTAREVMEDLAKQLQEPQS